MNNKTLWRVRNVLIALMVSMAGLAGLLFWQNHTVFAFAAPVILILEVIGVYILVRFRKEVYNLMRHLSREFGSSRSQALYDFPLPVIVSDENRKIVWYNSLVQESLPESGALIGLDMDLFSAEPLDHFLVKGGLQVHTGSNSFRIYGSYSKEYNLYTFYFFDNTELTKIAEEYHLSHPSVMLIGLDNYEAALDAKKESEKSAILTDIDEVLEEYFSKTNGFLRRFSRGQFLAVVEQRHLNKMIEQRFDILDRVREINKKHHVPITLSIGVGSQSQSLAESESNARQAMDMALGRGGDQAALKTKTGYDFYGGVSQGVERRTKVKSRVIATALREFVEQSSNVFVMGHRFGDLDSIGSAIALAQTVRHMGKRSYIVVDYPNTLAKQLIDRAVQAGNDDLFLEPNEASPLVNGRTLLFVLDTHNPNFVEDPELLKRCPNKIVVDHHRKMVNFIDNAIVFYHEPYASSTAEMVTELIQYMDGGKLDAIEAEGLLAGIMLDTKNFVLKTGVRTFEAAAYLRSKGADTVRVRKMFGNTIEAYKQKSRLVMGAELYRNCAIAVGDFQSPDIRVIAPQAADELLSISDVDASFVIFLTGSVVNISGRSLGTVNTQIIMEELGGGGHQTMAACQLKDMRLEDARVLLLKAIDHYYSNLNEINP